MGIRYKQNVKHKSSFLVFVHDVASLLGISLFWH